LSGMETLKKHEFLCTVSFGKSDLWRFLSINIRPKCVHFGCLLLNDKVRVK
jgi:hypothetical protein